MGATNTTTYYNLSQFIGTDKPAWLQDYNGDMLKIDTAINNAKVAADNAANAASAAQGDATTALGDIASLNTTVGTISNTLNTAVGNINTINSLIGNGTPTTTDQTIIGAINEINANVKAIVHFKGMERISVAHDGTKTVSDLYTELATALQTRIDAMSATARWLIASIGTGFGYEVDGAEDIAMYISKSTVVASTTFNGVRSSTNASTDTVNIFEVRFGASQRANYATITTGSVNVDDKLGIVATSDAYIDILKYDVE